MNPYAKLQRIDALCDGLAELLFRPHVLKLILQDAPDTTLDTLESVIIAALGRKRVEDERNS